MTSPPIARTSAAARHVDVAVGGMTCAACAARVERKLNKIDGVHADVNYATGRARVYASPDVADQELLDTVVRAGYSADLLRPQRPVPDGADDPGRVQRLWWRLIVSVVLFVPVADLSVTFTVLPGWRFPGWQWLLLALAIPVIGWAAWPFHRAAVRSLRHGSATMDTLVSLGIVAAASWSLYAMFFQAERMTDVSGFALLLRSEGAIYLEVAAGLTTFVLAGRYFEAKAKRSAGGALRELAALGSKDVTVLLDDGSHRTLPIDQLQVGQRFLVRPGSTIATDGRVVVGRGTVDTSVMTGESVPVEVAEAGDVVGGTRLLNGSIVVEATRVGQDTQLAAMVRMVEEAQTGEAGVQRLADRICAYFVPAVVGLSILTFAGWLLLGGSLEPSFSAALAVLVIACPCALGLATPTALMVASGRGARLGIFIKGYQALESTRGIDTVVLDKTGTVTEGEMQLVDVACVDGVSRAELLRLAGGLEQASDHPVAAAVTAAARAELGRLPQVAEFTEEPGLGATGIVDGHDVVAGRAKLLADRGIVLPESLERRREEWEQQARTTVVLSRDGRVIGLLGLVDLVKPSARTAVAELHRLGLRTVLLTGDNELTARAVAEEIGVTSFIAGVLPDAKAGEVRRLQAEGRSVAVVGDGVNDAPALATANLGMAVGTGTDIAIDAADLILVRSDLTVVPDAITLARATLRTIRGNLFWAFGYNVAAIPLAASGLLNPLVAGAAMAVSSLFVVSNSLRLRRFSSGPRPSPPAGA
jgi:Cu+-exporting ATPase